MTSLSSSLKLTFVLLEVNEFQQANRELIKHLFKDYDVTASPFNTMSEIFVCKSNTLSIYSRVEHILEFGKLSECDTDADEIDRSGMRDNCLKLFSNPFQNERQRQFTANVGIVVVIVRAQSFTMKNMIGVLGSSSIMESGWFPLNRSCLLERWIGLVPQILPMRQVELRNTWTEERMRISAQIIRMPHSKRMNSRYAIKWSNPIPCSFEVNHLGQILVTYQFTVTYNCDIRVS